LANENLTLVFIRTKRTPNMGLAQLGLDGKTLSFCLHPGIGFGLDRLFKALRFILKFRFFTASQAGRTEG
jgi:hypothetical protein